MRIPTFLRMIEIRIFELFIRLLGSEYLKRNAPYGATHYQDNGTFWSVGQYSDAYCTFDFGDTWLEYGYDINILLKSGKVKPL